MSRILNFNAGPASLPLPALERAREELLDFNGSGMSVMEHSHRGKVYEAVHHEALGLVAKLLGLTDEWEVLFLQGGASMAFATLPMNLLPKGQVADYIVNGTWGEKAVAEARAAATSLGCGDVHVAATTKHAGGYSRVARQDELALSKGATFVHCTSNETIHGIQYALSENTPFPRVEAPLAVDMSSDILGRVVDVSEFDLIYAGAQKNIGPSGVTLVCIKKELLSRTRRDLPAIFQYTTAAENASLYNTPPTFGIYLVRNVLTWLQELGGVPAVETRNRRKAAVLYEAIDTSGGFYRCPVDVACRSMMNVVWRLPDADLDARFVAEAESNGMVGLKGHRVVGGVRASLYNAVEPAWVDTLGAFMKDFVKRFG